jgi:hypothetical protein
MGQPERCLTLGGQGLLKAGKHDVEQIDRLARRRRPLWIGVLLKLQRQAVAVEHMPDAPVIGVRVVALDRGGAVVEVIDAETRTGLLARHRENLIRVEQLK